MKVVEAMHGAAGNHEDPAGAYLRDLSFDSEGEYAFQAIGGLFVAIVGMGTRDFAAGSHVELEHGDGIVCFVPLNEVADSDAANSDLILG
jgi:hypothetical protein